MTAPSPTVTSGRTPLKFTYLTIHKPPIPEALVEVPLPSWHSIEEAEFEEVADAEVGKGAEVGRELCGKQKPRPNERSRFDCAVGSNLSYTSGA